ncbi:MAG: UDP-N-acetylmuramoyl-L-alanyl-D-glutamate--2,6-diaminopimelate ligase [Candidatus Uhrbacteria bacterium]|nr:UDP-N-acetylmuramoyl-L-alanyl-D-glutamate--2,6-diaminopimelate ligase [Candidatus Uhrbacteria bacterium]
MLNRLKKLVPEPIVRVYHYVLARLAQLAYGNPSKDLIVIGVTGTNGKTTTAYFLAKALEASGFKTGCTTTAVMKVGKKEWLNKTKMTMPGRFFLQKTLRDMVKAGCKYAVVEVSSQGLIQHRHIGINYDLAVFTNLTPEHIEAHGGFEHYKRAKRRLFEMVDKAVLNADSDFIDYYAQTPGLEHIEWYSVRARKGLFPESMTLEGNGSSFIVEGAPVRINQPGEYNVSNALAALAVCKHYDVDLNKAAERLEAIHTVPGRFERVEIGQPWTVIVDYAPEPESFRRLYDALDLVPKKRVIHVLGSCGGGRDVSRRPILGRMAAERADVVIVTNEDPYDDDPQLIIDQVADGAVAGGKRDGKDLFRVLDRREAIYKAMEMARAGDLVVLTGKGCEPWICLDHGRKVPWDEVKVAKEAILNVRNQKSDA